jgi:splicing factor 3B subunit 3
MHLYNISLLPPTSITCACIGNFWPGVRQQQICVARGGTRLELLQIDSQTGKASSILSTDVFGTIRSLASFRLTGGTRGECTMTPRVGGARSGHLSKL